MSDAIKVENSHQLSSQQETSCFSGLESANHLPKFKIRKKNKANGSRSPRQKQNAKPQDNMTPLQKFQPLTTINNSNVFTFNSITSTKAKRTANPFKQKSGKQSLHGITSREQSREKVKSKEQVAQELLTKHDVLTLEAFNDSIISSKHMDGNKHDERGGVLSMDTVNMNNTRSQMQKSKNKIRKKRSVITDRISGELLSRSSKKRFQRIYFDIIEELMGSKRSHQPVSVTRHQASKVRKKFNNLISLLKDELDEKPQSLQKAQRKFKLRQSCDDSLRASTHKESMIEQQTMSHFDDTYLCNIQPLLSKSHQRILNQVKSRAFIKNFGTGSSRDSASTPRLGLSELKHRNPSPLRTLSKPASGKLLPIQDKERLKRENVIFLNRLYRIICRDNQHAGFLKPRGDFESQSSDGSQQLSDTETKNKESSKVLNHDDKLIVDMKLGDDEFREGMERIHKVLELDFASNNSVNDKTDNLTQDNQNDSLNVSNQYTNVLKPSDTKPSSVQISQADLQNKSQDFKQPNKLLSYLKNVKQLEPVEQHSISAEQSLYNQPTSDAFQTDQMGNFQVQLPTKKKKAKKNASDHKQSQFSQSFANNTEKNKSHFESNSSYNSSKQTTVTQDMSNAFRHSMVKQNVTSGMDLSEWKQPQLQMTSIGEQEKDEELDEANDSLKLQNEGSNVSNKFMTIQVESDFDQIEQPTRHDQYLNSVSNFENSKLSSIYAGSDRLKINSRGNIQVNQITENTQLTEVSRTRQRHLNRVNSLDRVGDQLETEGNDEDQSASIGKPHTSQMITRKMKFKNVMAKAIKKRSQRNNNGLFQGKSLDEKEFLPQNMDQNRLKNNIVSNEMRVKSKCQNDNLPQIETQQIKNIGSAQMESRIHIKDQRLSPSQEQNPEYYRSIFSSIQSQGYEPGELRERPVKTAKRFDELRKSQQYNLDSRQIKQNDPYIQYARNQRVLKHIKDLNTKLKGKIQEDKSKQLNWGVPSNFNHQYQSLCAFRRSTNLRSLNLKAQIKQQSKNISRGTSPNQEFNTLNVSRERLLHRNQKHVQYSSQERPLNDHDSPLQGSPVLQGANHYISFDQQKVSSIQNAAKHNTKKTRFKNNLVPEKQSSLNRSSKFQKNQSSAQLSINEERQVSPHRHIIKRQKMAPRVLSPLHKSSRDLNKLQTLDTQNSSCGQNLNDIANSSLMAPNNNVSTKNINVRSIDNNSSIYNRTNDQTGQLNSLANKFIKTAAHQNLQNQQHISQTKIQYLDKRGVSPDIASIDMIGSINSKVEQLIINQELDNDLLSKGANTEKEEMMNGEDNLKQRRQTSELTFNDKNKSNAQQLNMTNVFNLNSTMNDVSFIQVEREANSRLTNPLEIVQRSSPMDQMLKKTPFVSQTILNTNQDILSQKQSFICQPIQNDQDFITDLKNKKVTDSIEFNAGPVPPKSNYVSRRGTNKYAKKFIGIVKSERMSGDFRSSKDKTVRSSFNDELNILSRFDNHDPVIKLQDSRLQARQSSRPNSKLSGLGYLQANMQMAKKLNQMNEVQKKFESMTSPHNARNTIKAGKKESSKQRYDEPNKKKFKFTKERGQSSKDY